MYIHMYAYMYVCQSNSINTQFYSYILKCTGDWYNTRLELNIPLVFPKY